MLSIRRATSDDVPRAARTLAAAFVDYPWTRWSIPASSHEARLEQIQGLYIEHAVAHGLVLVDDEIVAVGAFLPDGAPEPAPQVQRLIADLHGDRLDALLAAELPARPAGAWELATLGVAPEWRGRGLGSKVVAAGLNLLDELDPGAAISLETSDPRNVRLYERHGFARTAFTRIDDGPDVHSMLRPAST